LRVAAQGPHGPAHSAIGAPFFFAKTYCKCVQIFAHELDLASLIRWKPQDGLGAIESEESQESARVVDIPRLEPDGWAVPVNVHARPFAIALGPGHPKESPPRDEPAVNAHAQRVQSCVRCTAPSIPRSTRSPPVKSVPTSQKIRAPPEIKNPTGAPAAAIASPLLRRV
jgi:hypothetical protein